MKVMAVCVLFWVMLVGGAVFFSVLGTSTPTETVFQQGVLVLVEIRACMYGLVAIVVPITILMLIKMASEK